MDSKSRRLYLLEFVALALFIILIGCSDDDPTTPYQKEETIVIDQTPDAMAGAGWTLTGPQNETGSGDTTFTDMPAGAYTIAWNVVSGYVTPISAPQTLTDNGTITFNGVYLPEGFVAIPADTFTMGSPTDEPDRESKETQHQVILTTPFYMFATEVTNQQYADMARWAYDQDPPLVTATTTSLSDNLDGSAQELLDLSEACEISFTGSTFTVDSGKEEHPVLGVSWYGAVAYCDWLSLREGITRAYDHSTWQCNGNAPYGASGYRLPTEAEWEYACRAGTHTPFNTGNCLDAGTEANYRGEFPYFNCPDGPFVDWTVPVGSYPANTFDLYDMHGNLFEWCNDWLTAYSGNEMDPVGSTTGSYRVMRDGCWNSKARSCRSAYRGFSVPGSFFFYLVGFRPVRSIF